MNYNQLGSYFEEEDDSFLDDFMEEDDNWEEDESLIDPEIEDWFTDIDNYVPSVPRALGTEIVTPSSKDAYMYLTQKGLPKHVSAGIVGNLVQESGLNPMIHEKGNTGNGRGIAQWDVRNRWKSFLNWSKQNQKNPYDVYTQLDFVVEEAKERGDLDRLMNTKTPEQAALIFSKYYERPNKKYANDDKRVNYARSLYKQKGGKFIENTVNTLDKGLDFIRTNRQLVADTISTGVETTTQLLSSMEDMKNKREMMRRLYQDDPSQYEVEQNKLNNIPVYV